jgi:hypothetical protein
MIDGTMGNAQRVERSEKLFGRLKAQVSGLIFR